MNKYKVNENGIGVRIDNYLIDILDYSRSKIQKMIKEGSIRVNDKIIKSSYQLKEIDVIFVDEYNIEESNIKPENIDIDIVYEDDDVLVINKNNGMVVHPAPSNNSGTLVNALLYHSEQLSTINGEFRPGIVHRIDAYTTGLLMVAKNDKSHELLAKQLERKTIKREYWALVWGIIPNDGGTIDAPIGRDICNRKKMAVTNINGKSAVTHFKVLERYKQATLIELKLETGRTHQIRVHMEYIGYPIVNDPVYGRKKIINDSGQCLHAKKLGFIHPKTKEYMEFDSDLPSDFLKIIEQFKNS